jgi:hypothetical protein
MKAYSLSSPKMKELLDAVDSVLWWNGGDDWETAKFIDYNPNGPDEPDLLLTRLRDARLAFISPLRAEDV